MRPVQRGPLLGLLAQVALLAVLDRTVGLGAYGWAFGVTGAAVTTVVLSRALAHHGADRLRPADRVTLIRVTLALAVGALVADAFVRPVSVPVMLALAAVALALDSVDGWVARRTATSWPLGARFDMEVDAFLILVLSVYVARTAGTWVLIIGAARYLFVAAGWSLPWLQQPVPPRYWRKAVAATQGVVLAVAAADVLPHLATEIAIGVSLALLVESFAHQVWWLWRFRPADLAVIDHRTGIADAAARAGRAPWRRALAAVLTASAAALVWFALVAPDDLERLTPTALLRIPLEGVLLVALVLAVPRRAARPVALTSGALLGVLLIWKVLDTGFVAALGRPFEPVVDWTYFGSAEGLLTDSIGRRDAVLVVIAAVALVLAVLALTPLAVLRLARMVERHRGASTRAVALVGIVWTVFALLGVQVAEHAPIASTSAAALGWDRLSQVHTDLHDQQRFTQAAAVDPVRYTPTDRLLTGLRGKDVIVAFVESYGRSAVAGSTFAPGVDHVLQAGTAQLQAAGFDSRSAFLTSPTFGGISWLAHSTLQSGLWIDNQLRYDQVVAGNRYTLSDAFRRAGWHTAVDVPSDTRPWPQARSFYHYDDVFNAHNVGYRGPKFSYAAMPDQYTLSAFDRRELGPGHAPVMAEIDLVSSHTPWTPIPRMISWDAVGDGSVYDPMPAQGAAPAVVWPDPAKVQAAYGRSIQYSLTSLISFVRSSHDKNLVLVMLGDHQPSRIVSGSNASHDVPISIVAHDPAVLRRIDGWGWDEGLEPGTQAPVWRMDAFRNRFLAAYGGSARS